MVIPLKPDKLEYTESSKALEAGKLVKEIINGVINGRTCPNGSKQKVYLKEVKLVASSTVLLEFLFVTLVINEYEGI